VPPRAAPLLAATLNVTVPLPLPDAPLAIAIQSADARAVHAQPLRAVTLIVPVPPLAGSDWFAGEIEKLHGEAACVTVNDFPATAIVPLRAAPGLAPTVNETVPLPFPIAPLVIEIHCCAFSVVAAVHEQLLPAVMVTFTVPVPPPAATD
jgi:hypothetical protein